MAETVKEKSAGLKFAEQQLTRHGWENGKGLGRKEDGISEAIKVQIKCGKGGVGHKEGEQFSFHWWDHVFNKASSNLTVDTKEDNVVVKVTDGNSDDLISNKKPRKAQQAKSKLYGYFIKSSTLLSGQEHPNKPSSLDDRSSSSGEDEDEDHKLDLSSTTKLSDEDLLNVCGGRTAHKGARHGLTMSAKLARLEEQEQEFMNKYGKKKQPAKTSANSEDNLDVTEKTKRKKSKRKEEPSEDNVMCDVENEDTNGSPAVMTDVEPKKKRKKNRKDKAQPQECFNGDCNTAGNEASTHTTEEPHQESNEASSRLKKGKRKRSEMVAELEVTDVISEDPTNSRQPLETSSDLQQTSNKVSKKKKKKKPLADIHETSEDVEDSTSAVMVEDINTEVQSIETEIEVQKKKRKKNKKNQERTQNEQDVVKHETFDEHVPKKKKKKTKD